MEYTKGTWRAEWNEITGTWVVVEQPGVGLIARCGSGKGYKSNAHLIASAPELYEACKAIINRRTESHELEAAYIPSEIELVYKAIAKAEGK